MNRRVASVLQGFHNLTVDEQVEFVAKVNEYITGSDVTKGVIIREANRYVFNVDMGPQTSGCPCCGRG